MPIRVYHEPGVGAGIALGVADAARAIGDAKIAAARSKYEAARIKAASMEALGQNIGRGIEQASQAYADSKRRMADWQRQLERDKRMEARWTRREKAVADRQAAADKRRFQDAFFKEYNYTPGGLIDHTGASSLGEAVRITKEEQQADAADADFAERELGVAEDIAQEQRQALQQRQRFDYEQGKKEDLKERTEKRQQEREARSRGEGWEPTISEDQRRKLVDLYQQADEWTYDSDIPEKERGPGLDDIEGKIRRILENPGGEKKTQLTPEQLWDQAHIETAEAIAIMGSDGTWKWHQKKPDRDDGSAAALKDARDYAKVMRLGDLDKSRTPKSTEEYMLEYVKGNYRAEEMIANYEKNRLWLNKAEAKVPQLDEQGLMDLGQKLQELLESDPTNRKAVKLRVKIADRLARLRQQKAIQQQTQMPSSQPAMAPAGGGGHGWMEGGG
jgi:hypothetical protein